MNRREFLEGSLAAAFLAGCRSPRVGETYPKWRPGEFQIHCIYTGNAESTFWIFPDGTTMLLDCGDTDTRKRDPAPMKLAKIGQAGDFIARYVTRVNPAADPTWVDYLMISHHHDDHTGGLPAAIRTLHFRKAFDRDYPNYTYPCRLTDYDEKAKPFILNVYEKLRARDGLVVENLKVGARDQVAALHGGAKDFTIFNLCANGIIADERTGKTIDCYAKYPDRQPDFKGNQFGKQWINENGLSLGLIVRYGDFSYYTAGDFSDAAYGVVIEDLLAGVVPQVTVAKLNHHGYFSMPPRLVAALRAKAYVNCVWNHNQNSAPTMKALSDRSLYPGDRRICPTFMTDRRPNDDVPAPAYEGAHLVLTVPPGGRDFTLRYLTADDDSMRVISEIRMNSSR